MRLISTQTSVISNGANFFKVEFKIICFHIKNFPCCSKFPKQLVKNKDFNATPNFRKALSTLWLFLIIFYHIYNYIP